jgi:hypothetical protein
VRTRRKRRQEERKQVADNESKDDSKSEVAKSEIEREQIMENTPRKQKSEAEKESIADTWIRQGEHTSQLTRQAWEGYLSKGWGALIPRPRASGRQSPM